MTQRIYIETTIPSFYYTVRTDEESHVRMNWTRQWWSECAELFWLTTSAAVIEELNESPSEMRNEKIALLKDVEIVEDSAEIDEIAQVYIDQLAMPFIWPSAPFTELTACLHGTI